jgi:hypothetical protein
MLQIAPVLKMRAEVTRSGQIIRNIFEFPGSGHFHFYAPGRGIVRHLLGQVGGGQYLFTRLLPIVCLNRLIS